MILYTCNIYKHIKYAQISNFFQYTSFKCYLKLNSNPKFGTVFLTIKPIDDY